MLDKTVHCHQDRSFSQCVKQTIVLYIKKLTVRTYLIHLPDGQVIFPMCQVNHRHIHLYLMKAGTNTIFLVGQDSTFPPGWVILPNVSNKPLISTIIVVVKTFSSCQPGQYTAIRTGHFSQCVKQTIDLYIKKLTVRRTYLIFLPDGQVIFPNVSSKPQISTFVVNESRNI